MGPLLFVLYITPLSLVIGELKGMKFHFYADDTKVYVHLSQKNSSAAFKQLHRCLDYVKEWLSTSELQLNPDKTELIIIVSKIQRDKLKTCLPIDILGSPLCPLESVKNLGVCGSILVFPCLNMFRMSAKVVLSKSVISDMSGGSLLTMLLYLWLMLL